jgi:hypothetical protein
MTTHVLRTLSDTTAVRLTPNGKHSGMDITLQNVNDSGYIYVGGEGVTSTNYGFRIVPSNHAISFELDGADALYAIAENDGAQLAVIQMNLEMKN